MMTNVGDYVHIPIILYMMLCKLMHVEFELSRGIQKISKLYLLYFFLGNDDKAFIITTSSSNSYTYLVIYENVVNFHRLYSNNKSRFINKTCYIHYLGYT